jgi:cell wall-associated NlpC family hydrolase
MNPRKIAVAGACAPVLLILLILILVLGGGGGASSNSETSASGQTTLNTAAVPPWAVQPLLAAAQTCPDITAPLLAAQLETESNWDPNAYNPQSKATGLAQFIPATWAVYGVDANGDGTADPRDPADAIKTQAIYMCHLVTIVKNAPGLIGDIVDLALAAYNAGPGNVLKFGGIPPFQETINYVTKIRKLANTKYAITTPPPATVSGRAAAVIQAANMWVQKGTPYAWGGGTLNGPSAGTGPDVGVIGFDCSSLVRYAYYQGTGQQITLPRVAQQQYDATLSQTVAVADLQPGDLLFYGTPTNVHHVALYIGNGQMIEAPQSGQLLHQTALRIKGSDFTGAHRVFGGPLDVANKA